MPVSGFYFNHSFMIVESSSHSPCRVTLVIMFVHGHLSRIQYTFSGICPSSLSTSQENRRSVSTQEKRAKNWLLSVQMGWYHWEPLALEGENKSNCVNCTQSAGIDLSVLQASASLSMEHKLFCNTLEAKTDFFVDCIKLITGSPTNEMVTNSHHSEANIATALWI